MLKIFVEFVFEQEVINSFNGGYRIHVPSVATLFGSPIFSFSRYSISIPLNVGTEVLIRKNQFIEWNSEKSYNQEYRMIPMDGTWSDPIKIMSNISIQRGWKDAFRALAKSEFTFNQGIGYLSSYITSIILAFSLSNSVKLSNAEIFQLNLEIQEKVSGKTNYVEPLTQLESRNNSLLFSEGPQEKFRNEIINFEPYSIYLVYENSLESNTSLPIFLKNRKKFLDENMMKKSKGSLSYPFSTLSVHYEREEDYYLSLLKASENNNIDAFLDILSQYSQSIMYNLNAISQSQKKIGELLLKYGARYFSFNICEHSGSILLFGDSPLITNIKDNVIREYYNMTNKTLTFRKIEIEGPVLYEKIMA